MKLSNRGHKKSLCFDRQINSRNGSKFSCLNPMLIPKETISLRLAKSIEKSRPNFPSLSKTRNSECRDDNQDKRECRERRVRRKVGGRREGGWMEIKMKRFRFGKLREKSKVDDCAGRECSDSNVQKISLK